MSELLPCPFCGGEGYKVGDKKSWVRCPECGAETTVKGSWEEAVALWNCRTLPAAEQAVVPLLDDWLLFADDIQPACAAGHDWLDSLRSRTQIALAKLRQGEGA